VLESAGSLLQLTVAVGCIVSACCDGCDGWSVVCFPPAAGALALCCCCCCCCQFPEKMIPKFTLLAARGAELPVHGDGQAVRR